MAVQYEVVDGVLKINAMNWAIPPSIEDSDAAMAIAIDKLMEARDAHTIIFVENREYEYDFEQTQMLREIADIYDKILNQERLLSLHNLEVPSCDMHGSKRLEELQFLVTQILRKDPIGAYVRLSMLISQAEKDGISKASTPNELMCHEHYLNYSLRPLKKILENTKIIQAARPVMQKYKVGDRSVYREFFSPVIRPNFMLTRYMANPPKMGKTVEKYYVGNTFVEIFRVPGKARLFYHVTPPEFMLSEDHYTLLDSARRYLADHKPSESEFSEPEKTRATFMNIGRDLLRDLAVRNRVQLESRQLEQLATILTRYTAGFGILEIILADEKVQDVYVNSPVGQNPIYLFHQDFEECETNLVPTKADAEAWATRFRLYSGRPLDESNPVLDTELQVPGGRARVGAITKTLSPDGLAYAFRRHREKPWTFPLFIHANYINPLYAGLMSFLIDGGRAMLIAGGRSSGKTSLLNAMMLELMRKFRIIVQEDTPEISVELMRKLGYNILGLKSRSVITKIETEMSPDEALRTALRLGDSVLIVGEVRSVESVALFEAMRIGALANLVAGTIHGESPYGVFDRVVNDLGVKPTSFKAIDVINIANMLKSPDGLHRFRRIVEVTEVRKKWKEDPDQEGAFYPLMQYSSKDDTLKPTDTLIDGESEVLNSIAKNVKEWRGAWDLVWDNILLRTKIKETMVDYARKLDRLEILEADINIESNEMFHIFSDDVSREVGSLDSKMIFDKWLEWFKERIK